MNDRSEELKTLIQEGRMVEALAMVSSAADYREAETFVFAVLREESSQPELVDHALQVFLNSRRTGWREHGYWVHSLSHFTDILWKRRLDLDAWIARFNEVAFRGANEGDPNCSDRLVDDFASFARWDEDPAHFHLTMDNLRWMKWGEDDFARGRIEHGAFSSEEEYVRWQLRLPPRGAFNYEAQMSLVDVGGIQTLLKRLEELGADTSEYTGLVMGLLEKQLAALEEESGQEMPDWKKERFVKAIDTIRSRIAALEV
ncbi:MAG: hypothetical protein V1778_02430 [bacterium]